MPDPWEPYVFGVSALALGLSLITLIAQFRRSYWDRPNVEVTSVLTMRAALHPNGSQLTHDPTDFKFHLDLAVWNVGDRAVTLTHAGWERQRNHSLKGSIAVSRGAHFEPTPYRLEPHDMVKFEATRQPDEPELNGATVWPFVETVTRRNFIARWLGMEPKRIVYGKSMLIAADAASDL